jgi:magnesium transporter
MNVELSPQPGVLAGKSRLVPLHELEFETAAEHHTRHVPVAAPHDSVSAVRESLRGQRFDSVSEIVVLDASGHLVGLVNIEDLLATPDETTLREIMDASPPMVMPGVDQEIAAWQAIRHRETSLAVVDAQGHFLGIIPPNRIFEVLLWEHDEDTARLGGFLKGSSEANTASTEPVLQRLGHRLPWLLVGLAGAIFSADLVALFEAQLSTHLILVFFVPGIIYLADAVGTQTETLVIRGLSVGISIERVFRRELVTGVLIGSVLAALLFPMVLWRWERADVAIAVSLALLAACSIASSVAMILPWTLRFFRQDPAFAAGPLATVIQDLLSLIIYFLVCLAIVR